jgi:hypothetical protein
MEEVDYYKVVEGNMMVEDIRIEVEVDSNQDKKQFVGSRDYMVHILLHIVVVPFEC